MGPSHKIFVGTDGEERSQSVVETFPNPEESRVIKPTVSSVSEEFQAQNGSTPHLSPNPVKKCLPPPLAFVSECQVMIRTLTKREAPSPVPWTGDRAGLSMGVWK